MCYKWINILRLGLGKQGNSEKAIQTRQNKPQSVKLKKYLLILKQRIESYTKTVQHNVV